MKLDDNYLIKIGNDDRPAGVDDLKHYRKTARKLSISNELEIISHHAITIERLPEGMKLFKLGNNEKPAIAEDIADFKKEISNARKEKRPIVYHHLLTVDIVK